MSMTRRGRRPVRTGAGTLALAVTLLVAACGDGEDPVATSPGTPSTGGSVTSTPEPSTTPPEQTPAPSGTGGGGSDDAAGGTRLTIVLDDGSGAARTWRLTCDPAGGDHPDPAAACAALAANGAAALPPVPKDRMCTQIYGGPDTATVTGTWNGQKVSATFKKTNGCEINRWKALEGLLPATGGAGS
jgi:hypothetical protein